jgi:hypothetical protein
MSAQLEERLAAMEARVRIMEDEMAIVRLISSYGPTVDSGQSQVAAALWTANGTYDVGGMEAFAGTEAIAALFDRESHQGLIRGGAGHVLNQPWVRVVGDRAVALGYSVVFKWDGRAFEVFRVSANRWELERRMEGWRVVQRTNRLLNGAQEARALLGSVNETGVGATPPRA